MKKLLALLSLSFLLAGCTITAKTPNSVTIDKDGDITIEQNGGDFCPPGQAKKGRC